MPSAFLSRKSFNQLKRAARQQLPGVQHAHALEALARALGQNNLAALNTRLSRGEDSPVNLFEFSYDELRLRLYALGYPDALNCKIDFSSLTDIFRVRKPYPLTLAELQALGIISPAQRLRLAQLVEERRTVLIVGATGSGKSLLMYVLLNEMALRAPQDEFVLCEWHKEGPEFAPNVARFELRPPDGFVPGGVPALGHRRVAIDELVGGTALPVLRSWTSVGGGVGTLYARSADDAFEAITRVLGAAGTDMVRGAVDVVVHMQRERLGDVPRVAEINNRADQQTPDEPPEFQNAWGEQAALRLVQPEEADRYVLQDSSRLGLTRLSGDETIPFDVDLPVIRNAPPVDAPVDHERPTKNLSFILPGSPANGEASEASSDTGTD